MGFSFRGHQTLVPHWGGGAAPVVDPPVAAFSANVLFGTVPFEVEFTDESANSPTSWDWDFGDGSTHSTDQNPTHEYTTVGVYTVTLIATNAGGNDTETKTDYISAYREVTLTLQPDAAAGIDTLINEFIKDNDYGIATTVNAGTGPSAGRRNRGLIKFDVSSIPAGSIVSSAALWLYCEAELAADDRNVAVHRALTQWFEGSNNGPVGAGDASTWNWRNNSGSVAWAGGIGGGSGTDYAASATDTVSITGTGTGFTWDVLADVAAWVAGTTNNGLWLIGDGVNLNSRKDFTSSDGAIAGNRPKLVVVYKTTTPA